MWLQNLKGERLHNIMFVSCLFKNFTKNLILNTREMFGIPKVGPVGVR